MGKTSSGSAAHYNDSPAGTSPMAGGIAPPQSVRETIPATSAGLRLDQALARLFPHYSRSRLQAWVKDGTLKVEGLSEAKAKVLGGEAVVLDPPAATSTMHAPQALPLTIVFEDDSLLVLDKPAGLVVHPGAGNPDRTLLNALLAHAPALAEVPRAGIVHRLDKDTSGLLVVAKTLAAQTSLVRQLQARTMGRTYTALAWGSVRGTQGVIDAPIGRDARSRTRMAVTDRGKEARTGYKVLERLPAATLLACKLESGRTHQIRVHLQSIGHPLVGDPVYRRGAKSLPVGGFKRQALHAARLELLHPRTGKARSWESALPQDFRELIELLRKADAA